MSHLKLREDVKWYQREKSSFYHYIQRNPVIFVLSNRSIQFLLKEKPNSDKTKCFVKIVKRIKFFRLVANYQTSTNEYLKGYLRYKTILFHKVALGVQLMNFFIWRKKCFVLEISRFLCFCEIGRFQNPWRHHKHC